jgi:type III secretion system YscQ/HrcQ family protein
MAKQPETLPVSLDGIARLTRVDAERLQAAGSLARHVGTLRGAIEAVLLRYSGMSARLRPVVPRTVSDMRPTSPDAPFEGIVARLRCPEPPATLLVLVPRSLARLMAESVLGPLDPMVDPLVYEAVVIHVIGDVLRCLPAGLPLVRLDAIASVDRQEALPSSDDDAVLFVRVRVGDRSDLVTLVASSGSLAGLNSAMGPGRAAPEAVLTLGYEASLVVGITHVAPGELARLERGDVIMPRHLAPGGVRTTPAGCDLALTAAGRTRFVARCRLEGTAAHVVAGGPMIMEGLMEREDERTVVDGPEQDREPGAAGDPDRVGHLPAEVVVEAGRARLSVAELMRLAPGSVISLGRPVSAEVTLTVGGREVAHGVLVEVEGEIGVQVLQVIG